MPAGAGLKLVNRFNANSYKGHMRNKKLGVRTSGSPYRNALAAKLKATRKAYGPKVAKLKHAYGKAC